MSNQEWTTDDSSSQDPGRQDRQPSASAVRDHWARFLIAEYESLRAESGRALEAQHKIIEWSVGAFALVFVAVLAVSDGSMTGARTVRLTLFGAVLPLLLISSAFLWLSELFRMERVGAYLRARESYWLGRAHSTDPERMNPAHDPTRYPLLWETSIQCSRKEQQNFLGGFLIFGTGILICLVVFTLNLWMGNPHRWLYAIFQVLAVLPAALYAMTIPARFCWDEHYLDNWFEPNEAPRSPDRHFLSLRLSERGRALIGIFDPSGAMYNAPAHQVADRQWPNTLTYDWSITEPFLRS